MKKTLERLPTNVRLPAAQKRRLHRIAQIHGIRPSTLIRDAIAAKLPIWERHGVTLTGDHRES